jgi:hypothetical protein
VTKKSRAWLVAKDKAFFLNRRLTSARSGLAGALIINRICIGVAAEVHGSAAAATITDCVLS